MERFNQSKPDIRSAHMLKTGFLSRAFYIGQEIMGKKNMVIGLHDSSINQEDNSFIEKLYKEELQDFDQKLARLYGYQAINIDTIDDKLFDNIQYSKSLISDICNFNDKSIFLYLNQILPNIQANTPYDKQLEAINKTNLDLLKEVPIPFYQLKESLVDIRSLLKNVFDKDSLETDADRLFSKIMHGLASCPWLAHTITDIATLCQRMFEIYNHTEIIRFNNNKPKSINQAIQSHHKILSFIAFIDNMEHARLAGYFPFSEEKYFEQKQGLVKEILRITSIQFNEQSLVSCCRQIRTKYYDKSLSSGQLALLLHSLPQLVVNYSRVVDKNPTLANLLSIKGDMKKNYDVFNYYFMEYITATEGKLKSLNLGQLEIVYAIAYGLIKIYNNQPETIIKLSI